MKVRMIYHTPDYHKLVEAVARVCYQSYDKVSPTSHNMVKSILKKGHLSIASVGNMVFEVDLTTVSDDEIDALVGDLLAFKQANNYIRWTTPHHCGSDNDRIIISMNMLTLQDIANGPKNGLSYVGELFNEIMKEVAKVPYLLWFFDDSVDLEPSDNRYISVPSLGGPVVLTEDYLELEHLGLTPHELNVHATVTVDFITDRASGLQMWRHSDMTGGCELSQRYCDRSNAMSRRMEKIDTLPEALTKYAEKEGLTTDEAVSHYRAVVQTIDNHHKATLSLYSDLIPTLRELGVSTKRAKEIARSILNNSMTTRIIQCRPLKQWMHLFKLRDTAHAQMEVRADIQAIKAAFKENGIPVDDLLQI